MAGAMLEVVIDTTTVGKALDDLIERLGDLTTPLNDIAEYLHQSTDDRLPGRSRRTVHPGHH